MKSKIPLIGLTLLTLTMWSVLASGEAATSTNPGAAANVAINVSDNPVSISNEGIVPNNAGGANNSGYWTAERIKNAKPMPLPRSAYNPDGIQQIQELTDRSLPQGENGRPPRLRVGTELFRHLFVPDEGGSGSGDGTALDEVQTQEFEVVPQDFGTGNAYFSSQRLVPLNADRSFPYRAVGKLFFTIPGVGDAVCSASVIRPRVVLTAGHCVHSGTASGFFANFLFVPALRSGNAPFGVWDWSYVIVTGTWASGGGTVPNAADYAMIEVVDQTVSGALSRIGDITGSLGYQTNTLLPNHAHLLGYPVAFDSGVRMHQVTSQSHAAGGNNTVLYGSDMTGGSSGGPWVMNFGAASSGQTGGLQPARNRVIGITSYGFVDPAIKIQGSSIPDSRFIGILNQICANQPGNC